MLLIWFKVFMVLFAGLFVVNAQVEGPDCYAPAYTLPQKCVQGIYIINGTTYYNQCGFTFSGPYTSYAQISSQNVEDCLTFCSSDSNCQALDYGNSSCSFYSALDDIVSAPGNETFFKFNCSQTYATSSYLASTTTGGGTVDSGIPTETSFVLSPTDIPTITLPFITIESDAPVMITMMTTPIQSDISSSDDMTTTDSDSTYIDITFYPVFVTEPFLPVPVVEFNPTTSFEVPISLETSEIMTSATPTLDSGSTLSTSESITVDGEPFSPTFDVGITYTGRLLTPLVIPAPIATFSSSTTTTNSEPDYTTSNGVATATQNAGTVTDSGSTSSTSNLTTTNGEPLSPTFAVGIIYTPLVLTPLVIPAPIATSSSFIDTTYSESDMTTLDGISTAVQASSIETGIIGTSISISTLMSSPILPLSSMSNSSAVKELSTGDGGKLSTSIGITSIPESSSTISTIATLQSISLDPIATQSTTESPSTMTSMVVASPLFGTDSTSLSPTASSSGVRSISKNTLTTSGISFMDMTSLVMDTITSTTSSIVIVPLTVIRSGSTVTISSLGSGWDTWNSISSNEANNLSSTTNPSPKDWNGWQNASSVDISKFVTITLTTTFVVPCPTGWSASTFTLITTHCGCTETPVPSSIPMITYTTICPSSWSIGSTEVIVKIPAQMPTSLPNSSPKHGLPGGADGGGGGNIHDNGAGKKGDDAGGHVDNTSGNSHDNNKGSNSKVGKNYGNNKDQSIGIIATVSALSISSLSMSSLSSNKNGIVGNIVTTITAVTATAGLLYPNQPIDTLTVLLATPSGATTSATWNANSGTPDGQSTPTASTLSTAETSVWRTNQQSPSIVSGTTSSDKPPSLTTKTTRGTTETMSSATPTMLNTWTGTGAKVFSASWFLMYYIWISTLVFMYIWT